MQKVVNKLKLTDTRGYSDCLQIIDYKHALELVKDIVENDKTDSLSFAFYIDVESCGTKSKPIYDRNNGGFNPTYP